jgi:hypothetical protein
MINAGMRTYEYYTYEKENQYGQRQLSTSPVGTIKMVINLTSQSVQDNINYKEAQYMGLTRAEIDDNAVIQFGNEKLKVQSINPFGRMNQVFMVKI